MARMTPEGDALVIRLVYDGPPRSGKTTSLAALARGMARAVFSPAVADERTLYFDWLDYIGGNFDGIPIRCQILSVPGQRELSARRLALLADADAAVFVTDCAPERLGETAEHLRELRSLLAARPAPRPGVVVQANHRDRPGVMPLPALRAALGLDGIALVESVATESQGIREAFVLAVRLALDRAREQRAQGNLAAAPGATDSPASLLAWLQAAEEGAPPAAVSAVSLAPAAPSPAAQTPTVAAEARRSRAEPAAEELRPPRLPDSDAPSGRVWPPIDGRMLLHSAAAPGAVPRRSGDGSWRVRSGHWHFHSAAELEFSNLDDAKRMLLLWAHSHGGGFERLSPYRCLALTETGWGSWRLWQVVRAEESLLRRIAAALRHAASTEPAALAEQLRLAALRLLEARAAFRSAPALPCKLAVVGDLQGRAAYIGLLPPPGWEPSADELAASDADLLRREIQPLLAPLRGAHRPSFEALLAALALPAADDGHSAAAATARSAILTGV